MTNTDLKDSWLAEASMAAEDCKISADYAAHAFKRRDLSEGRRYVLNLEDNLSRLRGFLSMAGRAAEKEGSNKS